MQKSILDFNCVRYQYFSYEEGKFVVKVSCLCSEYETSDEIGFVFDWEYLIVERREKKFWNISSYINTRVSFFDLFFGKGICHEEF